MAGRRIRSLRVLGVLAVLATSTGCAQVDRAVFDFNLGLARHVLEPMSRSYQKVVPKPVRTGLRNVTDNIGYTEVLANNLLQGKLDRAATDLQRIVVNTLCFGGLFDAATDIGIPRYDEDFGQTLGVWGFGPGPYFNIPFLGPSTARDVWEYPFEFATSPFTYVDATAVSLPLSVASYLFERFDEVENLDVIDEAVDPYAFVKDAYLQQRVDDVTDGYPPVKATDEEAIDDVLEGMDELDELDDLDELDGLDGLDGLDEMNGLGEPDRTGESAGTGQPDGLGRLSEPLEADAVVAHPLPAPRVIRRPGTPSPPLPAGGAGALPPPRVRPAR